MIRGAIEVATRSLVSGWLYSSAFNLHGQLILAFVNGRHVGSGKVELFRKALKDAGLGDGYSGFQFAVIVRAGEPPEGIVVCLDHSDLKLIQPGSVVVPRNGNEGHQALTKARPPKLQA